MKNRKSIVGSTPTNPINLREGGRVKYKLGEQDGRPCALEVLFTCSVYESTSAIDLGSRGTWSVEI